jgi:hypothetical protein
MNQAALAGDALVVVEASALESCSSVNHEFTTQSGFAIAAASIQSRVKKS